MTTKALIEAFDTMFPKSGHPLVVAAMARMKQAAMRTDDAEVLACLRFALTLVGDMDPAIWEGLRAHNPEMWNDETFKGLRGVHSALLEFAGPDLKWHDDGPVKTGRD
jgi:hypothetical protein